LSTIVTPLIAMSTSMYAPAPANTDEFPEIVVFRTEVGAAACRPPPLLADVFPTIADSAIVAVADERIETPPPRPVARSGSVPVWFPATSERTRLKVAVEPDT
jgi:hypothetical protein